MQTVLHPANSRGFANHGWLTSYHSFSFGAYNNPNKINFGAIRVLNDDTVSPGMGFGMHPHQNMEIISIPLLGSLQHKDSMGNTAIINQGDIQVMSAGTGITHSEYNNSPAEPVKFLQIWVIPNKNNVSPRYQQITINQNFSLNNLQQIVSPNANDAGVWIHQNAWFYLAKFDDNFNLNYNLKNNSNGVYVFVLNGSFSINNQLLNTKDAIGIWETENFTINSQTQNAELLIMEVPMVL
jgi:quercetin 2,3-dioxygenase